MNIIAENIVYNVIAEETIIKVGAGEAAQVIEIVNEIVENEVPSGAINGTNATFTTQYDFIPESLEVFLNGIKQKIVDDYNTTGTQTIILNFSPVIGEKILVTYIKQ